LVENESLTKDFLKATAKGYKFATENPIQTAKIVIKVAKHKGIELSDEMVEASALEIASA